MQVQTSCVCGGSWEIIYSCCAIKGCLTSDMPLEKVEHYVQGVLLRHFCHKWQNVIKPNVLSLYHFVT